MLTFSWVFHPSVLAYGPLIVAVIDGDPDWVISELQKGADVNERGWRDHTALEYAIDHNNSEVVGLLLNAGADVDLKDDDGKTALHHAVGYYHPEYYGYRSADPEIVKLLLKHGADVNVRDADGQTPLELAEIEIIDEQGRILQHKNPEAAKFIRDHMQELPENIFAGLEHLEKLELPHK